MNGDTAKWVCVIVATIIALGGVVASFTFTSARAENNAQDIREVKDTTRRIWAKVSEQDATLNRIVGKLDAMGTQ